MFLWSLLVFVVVCLFFVFDAGAEQQQKKPSSFLFIYFFLPLLLLLGVIVGVTIINLTCLAEIRLRGELRSQRDRGRAAAGGGSGNSRREFVAELRSLRFQRLVNTKRNWRGALTHYRL